MHGKKWRNLLIDSHTPKVQRGGSKVYTITNSKKPFDAFDTTCENCHDQSKEKLTEISLPHKRSRKMYWNRLRDRVDRATSGSR